MIMNFLLGIIIGFGLLHGFYFIRNKIYREVRKGVFTTRLVDNTDQTNFIVNYEIEEIARSNKKSKIKILSFNSEISKYNAANWKDAITNFYDNAWIKTSEIDWIKYTNDPNDPKFIRDKKINQILK